MQIPARDKVQSAPAATPKPVTKAAIAKPVAAPAVPKAKPAAEVKPEVKAEKAVPKTVSVPAKPKSELKTKPEPKVPVRTTDTKPSPAAIAATAKTKETSSRETSARKVPWAMMGLAAAGVFSLGLWAHTSGVADASNTRAARPLVTDGPVPQNTLGAERAAFYSASNRPEGAERKSAMDAFYRAYPNSTWGKEISPPDIVQDTPELDQILADETATPLTDNAAIDVDTPAITASEPEGSETSLAAMAPETPEITPLPEPERTIAEPVSAVLSPSTTEPLEAAISPLQDNNADVNGAAVSGFITPPNILSTDNAADTPPVSVGLISETNAAQLPVTFTETVSQPVAASTGTFIDTAPVSELGITELVNDNPNTQEIAENPDESVFELTDTPREQIVALPAEPEPVAGPVIVEAAALESPAPSYPDKALDSGPAVDVLLRYDISEEGKAINIEAINVSGPRRYRSAFERSAIRALTASTFSPRTEDGIPAVEEGVERAYQFRAE